MSILDRLRGMFSGFRLGASAISDLRHPTAWLQNAMGGAPTASGMRVSADTANNYAAYFAAKRAISEDVAKLPFNVYKRLQPRGKEIARQHPAHTLIHEEFNPTLSAQTGRELLQDWALGWGWGPAEIVRDGSGRARELWPIHPDKVTPKRDGRRLFYEVRRGGDQHDGATEKTRLMPGEIFWLRGTGDDLGGYSIARLAREAVGLGMGAEEFGANVFGNDTTLGIVLSHPGSLDPKLKKDLQERLEGRKRFKVLVGEAGMKVERTAIPPQDAQFLETRQFQVVEIARWFRMPPHKLASLDRATFSNIEHQSIEYVVDTLLPWLVRWEVEVRRKLFGAESRAMFFAEHVVNGLLRGDFATRTAGYQQAINAGWLSPNDVRELENLNPIADKGGSKYFMQGALKPIEQLAEKPDPLAAPLPRPGMAPPPQEPPEEEEEDEARYRPLFEHVAARVVRREIKALQKPLERLRGDYAGFLRWSNQFYSDHRAYLEAEFGPVLASTTGGDLTVWVDDWHKESLERAGRLFRNGSTKQLEDYEPELAAALADRLMGV